MRSWSSWTVRVIWSARESASSSASAAWWANEAAIARLPGVNACRPAARPKVRVPRTFRRPDNGRTIIGPLERSWAMLATSESKCDQSQMCMRS